LKKNNRVLKATAVSPANIAFIKYWGQKDSKLILPCNNSISMNIDNCLTTTTVEFSPKYKRDIVKIKFFGEKEKERKGRRTNQLLTQVDRFRKMAEIDWKVKILSRNSFPSDAGIADSASAFSALTFALTKALGLEFNKKELSIQTRLAGSGSACRSIIDGFAEWKKGNSSHSSYAVQIADEDHWSLADIVVVVNQQLKEVSSWRGHQLAETSFYFKARLKELPERVKKTRQAIKTKNFELLGQMIEQDAVSMHFITMTSKPPVFYWNGTTLDIIQALRRWRKNGLLGYFTIDAGPNVHVICQQKDIKTLERKLKRISGVKFTIINKPCRGARIVRKHLF